MVSYTEAARGRIRAQSQRSDLGVLKSPVAHQNGWETLQKVKEDLWPRLLQLGRAAPPSRMANMCEKRVFLPANIDDLRDAARALGFAWSKIEGSLREVSGGYARLDAVGELVRILSDDPWGGSDWTSAREAELLHHAVAVARCAVFRATLRGIGVEEGSIVISRQAGMAAHDVPRYGVVVDIKSGIGSAAAVCFSTLGPDGLAHAPRGTFSWDYRQARCGLTGLLAHRPESLGIKAPIPPEAALMILPDVD